MVTQSVFYEQGVGTEGGLASQLLGGVSGLGLSKNIKDAYRFLMHNYEDSERGADEIFLFGFSRGAYAARSLAGFLRNSGLLKTLHADRLDEAFELYRSDAHPTSDEAIDFRAEYSREVEIQFLGVWDTVGALGIPPQTIFPFLDPFANAVNAPFQFHDVELSGSVKHAYQALAIDERSAPFEPSIWKPREEDGVAVTRHPKPGQVVEQVWFAGYHGDVGGGSPEAGLSDIAFTWMQEKAHDCGLEFDNEYVAARIAPDPLGDTDEARATIIELAGTYDRPLGKTWPKTEFVHPEVIIRQKNADPIYDPDNLDEYRASEDYQVAKAASTQGALPQTLRTAGP
jgi:uncharacterized protein (DUF2235 family)